MREYFKKTKISRSKLYKFAKTNGADYIENDSAVWIKPKLSGHDNRRDAIQMRKDGKIIVGDIIEDSLNFGRNAGAFHLESQKWAIEVLKKTVTFKP